MLMANLLTATEIKMLKLLPDFELGLQLADYSLDFYAEFQAGGVTPAEIAEYREQHRDLCAAYTMKLCARISDTRRTYGLLQPGHRLKEGVRAELEGLQAIHADICRSHHEQRQWLSRFD